MSWDLYTGGFCGGVFFLNFHQTKIKEAKQKRAVEINL